MEEDGKKKFVKLKTNKSYVASKFVFWFIFAILVGTMAFIIVDLSVGGFTHHANGKSWISTVGNLVYCVIALIGLFLPSITEKSFKVRMPSAIYIMLVIFLFLSVYLGFVVDFYEIVPYFDTFVHTFSGIVLGLLSMSFLKFISDKSETQIKPWFILVFSVCFAVTLGVFWEVWEFFRDCYFGKNMQRFADVKTGELLIGQAALKDTMKDLIVDTVGALCAGFIGFFAVMIDDANFNRLTFEKAHAKIKNKKKIKKIKNSQEEKIKTSKKGKGLAEKDKKKTKPKKKKEKTKTQKTEKEPKETQEIKEVNQTKEETKEEVKI